MKYVTYSAICWRHLSKQSFFYVQETWRKSMMYPYHHGRNLFNLLKGNTISIWRGEELPEESKKDKLYGHRIVFFETMTESLMQLGLNTLVLREFGISPNRFEAFNQVSGLFSSLISIILLFAKVRTKHNQIVIVFIHLGFSLSIRHRLYANLKMSYNAIMSVRLWNSKDGGS